MNKFILKFELIDGDAIKEEWETDKDIKEFNIQIAQLIVRKPWYTIIDETNKATNINISHVKYFTITSK